MEQGFYNKAEYNSSSCVDPTTLDGGAASGNLCHYCFDDGAGTTSPDSAEYGYFDRLHKQIESDYCVDTDKQFYAGYSSGGWMAHQLGCQFPDVLRAQGSVTGGLPPAIHIGAKVCVDHPIAAFLIHDSADPSNPYSGSVAALERLLRLNECHGDKDTAPHEPYTVTGMPNTSTFDCVKYTGCLRRLSGRVLHDQGLFARLAERRRGPGLLAVLQGPLIATFRSRWTWRAPRRAESMKTCRREPRCSTAAPPSVAPDVRLTRARADAGLARTAGDEGEHAGLDEDVAVGRRLADGGEEAAG